MSDSPDVEVKNKYEDRWWFPFVKPYMSSLKREDCGVASIEVGVESFVVIYVLTAFGLKRRNVAFRNASIALFITPIVFWPFCTANNKQVAVETVLRSIKDGT